MMVGGRFCQSNLIIRSEVTKLFCCDYGGRTSSPAFTSAENGVSLHDTWKGVSKNQDETLQIAETCSR